MKKKLPFNSQAVTVTHLDKILFPKDGVTKEDIIAYYQDISTYMLPFLKDRPLIVQRFVEGIEKEGFFQQHPPPHMPKWFHTCTLTHKTGERMEHFLCQDVDSLIYLVNFGVIVFHRWQSRFKKSDVPDVITIDLDPPKNGFALVCKAAKAFKKCFDQKKLHSFVMTTGSRGLHVLVPIKPRYHFDEVREWVQQIAEQLAKEYPQEFTIEIRKNARHDRVFIDILRNAYGHTAVCPYSIRALPGAPIATPLAWEEVNARLNPQKYTIKNIRERLNKKDPWKDFWKYQNQTISI